MHPTLAPFAKAAVARPVRTAPFGSCLRVPTRLPRSPCEMTSRRNMFIHTRASGFLTCAAKGKPSDSEVGPSGNLWQSAASLCVAAVVMFSALLTPPISLADMASPAANPFSAEQYQRTPVDKMPKPDLSDLTPEEAATVRVFINNTPSVVNISNNVLARNQYSMDVMTIPQGMGSGFVWDDKGHVITNYHVIKGANAVKVTLIDQSSYDATVVGADPNRDVAVLKLDMPPDKAKALKRVTLGSSANLQVGQRVYAIGNPFGLEHAMTSGIVSGLGRELPSTVSGYKVKNVIQVDAAINPGNSGGVLLNSKGQLIGVNTAIVGTGGSFSGVGFAIPIDMVKGLAEQIIEYGKPIRPVLGITLAPPAILERLGVSGVLVLEVNDGSPAAKAGIQASYRSKTGELVIGDIISGIDSAPVKNYSDLFDLLDSKRPGQRITVDVLRAGQDGKLRQSSINVTLGERSQVAPDS